MHSSTSVVSHLLPSACKMTHKLVGEQTDVSLQRVHDLLIHPAVRDGAVGDVLDQVVARTDQRNQCGSRSRSMHRLRVSRVWVAPCEPSSCATGRPPDPSGTNSSDDHELALAGPTARSDAFQTAGPGHALTVALDR